MKENYQLIDCGNFRKLEKFGDFLIDRPSQVANWNKNLNDDLWKQADFYFDKESGWKKNNKCEENLFFKWKNIVLKLYLTDNGQLGVFPEHYINWKFIYNVLKNATGELNILNGFAYTGAATIASSLMHDENRKIKLTHVDSSKPVITKAKDNAKLSKVDKNPIRWIMDDIVSFMEKEVKRGNVYNGIILDPPAFGKGKGKKNWKLQKDLPYLIELSGKLMWNNPCFFILSCHEQSITLSELQKLTSSINFKKNGKYSKVNMVIPSKHGNSLPAGISVCWVAD